MSTRCAIFESDLNRDERSSKLTRRLFLAGGGTALASLAIMIARRPPGVEASLAVHGSPGEVTIVNVGSDGTILGAEKVEMIVKTDGEWYRQLGANSFRIARQADTEMPYSGVTWQEHAKGIYSCICCDTALFSSQTKFDSGTGWPSFWAAIANENVLEKSDTSLGMERTEVQCARCEAHLGHVFNDGPEPTGLRYCMNSASMRFVKS
jgi:peptide-methionine (R)-S-oxide reductase